MDCISTADITVWTLFPGYSLASTGRAGGSPGLLDLSLNAATRF